MTNEQWNEYWAQRDRDEEARLHSPAHRERVRAAWRRYRQQVDAERLAPRRLDPMHVVCH